MLAKIDPKTLAVTRFKQGRTRRRGRAGSTHARRHHLVRRRGARHARPHQSRDRRGERVAGARRAGLAALRADQGRSGSPLVLGDRSPQAARRLRPEDQKFISVNVVSGNVPAHAVSRTDPLDVVRYRAPDPADSSFRASELSPTHRGTRHRGISDSTRWPVGRPSVLSTTDPRFFSAGPAASHPWLRRTLDPRITPMARLRGFSGGFGESSCDACHFEAAVNTPTRPRHADGRPPIASFPESVTGSPSPSPRPRLIGGFPAWPRALTTAQGWLACAWTRRRQAVK